MLYILYGTDTVTIHEKGRALADSLLAKRPDASYIKADVESCEPAQFDELLYGQGLFARKYIVVFDRVFENGDTKKTILDRAEEFGRSENIFIFLEGACGEKTLRALSKHAKTARAYNARAGRATNASFNVFSLADALCARERKNLWVLLQRAQRAGISDEEIVGVLFWQAKAMLLVRDSTTPQDAGLSPFAFRKVKRFQARYTKNEILSLSRELVRRSHDARRGEADGAIALERLILDIAAEPVVP